MIQRTWPVGKPGRDLGSREHMRQGLEHGKGRGDGRSGLAGSQRTSSQPGSSRSFRIWFGSDSLGEKRFKSCSSR